jgi:hypothetical protein
MSRKYKPTEPTFENVLSLDEENRAKVEEKRKQIGLKTYSNFNNGSDKNALNVPLEALMNGILGPEDLMPLEPRRAFARRMLHYYMLNHRHMPEIMGINTHRARAGLGWAGKLQPLLEVENGVFGSKTARKGIFSTSIATKGGVELCNLQHPKSPPSWMEKDVDGEDLPERIVKGKADRVAAVSGRV